MKKIALLTAAMLLSASSALAFTNEAAGYTINNKNPELVMQNAQMYAYAGLATTDLHLVIHFDTREMSGLVGKKFTTAYFDKSCNDLMVMKGAKAEGSLANLPVFDFANYGKLSANSSAVLESATKLQLAKTVLNNATLTKVAGKKAVTIPNYFKDGKDFYANYITLVSANDKMYMLVTGLKKANDANTQTKDALSKDVPQITNLQGIDASQIAPEALAAMNANHNKFVKAFKFMETAVPQKASIKFTDALAKRTVELPSDWCYAQFNYKNGPKPAAVTVSMPSNTFNDLGKKLQEKNLLTAPGMDNTKLMLQMGDMVLGELKDVVVTGSYSTGGDKEIANMLANPGATQLQLEMFLKQGLSHLKRIGNQSVKLNDYKYKINIDKNVGTVTILADVTAMGKHNFLNRLKLTGNPQTILAAWQLHNKAAEINKNAAAIYEAWNF